MADKDREIPEAIKELMEKGYIPTPPPEPEPELEAPPEVPESTGWRPDFRKDNPWEGMPQEYVEREAAVFKPTEEHPLPPSQETPEGLSAREKAPEVSEEKAAIKLAPGSTPDKPLFTQEDYDKFQELQDEEKFVKGKELGLVPEGSEFAPGLKVTYAPEVPEEERILKPREWGYYTPEQVAEIEKVEAEAKATYEAKVRALGISMEAIEARVAREKTEFETKLKDMPAEFQDAYKEGGIEGYNKYVETYTADLRATHTQLPDKQWINKEELAKLEGEIPKAHKILTEYGFSGYNTYLDINYIKLPDDQLIKVTDADAILTQSKYGYDILRKQGYQAYQDAVDKALEEVKPFEKAFGYNLRMAAAQGVSADTLSLIFPPDDVEKVKYFHREPATAPLEDIPTEIKPVSGLPPELIATLPVLGAVAVVEPTFIGEVIVGAAVLGAATYAVARGKDIKWGALWDEITGAFRKETGREPTAAEVAEMETVAATAIKASAVPVLDMPQAVALKVAEPIPVSPPAFPAKLEVPITAPPFPVAERIPISPPDFPKVAVKLEAPPFPIIEPIPVSPPPFPAKIEAVLPQIIAAQVAVAVADDELATIIKPKVMTPSELDAIWNVPLDKKAQALIALDAAVQDAFTAGEIDADTLRVYSQARTNYLTKKGLLDAASKAYISGMQPELISTTQELAASAFIVALSDLQEQATKAATEAYQQALTQGLTQAQATTAAQTAAQNAIQTASQTAIQQAIQTATQQAVQTATQTMTKAAAKTATDTLTSTATQTATQTAVNTAVATATATMTQTATTTAIGIVPVIPIIPLPEVESIFKRTKKVEPGTIEWRQGLFWRYLEPPAYKELRTSKTPLPGTHKFAVGEDSAYKTIQVLNGVPAKDILDIDIGIAIVDIRRKGKELTIHFKRDVEDVYKGKEVKEKITVTRPPLYSADETGKMVRTEEPKKAKAPRPVPVEELMPKVLVPVRRKKIEKAETIGDRYYLGHKLPDSNVKVEL